MEQRLEVCTEQITENPKINKTKLLKYSGVRRSTFFAQKIDGLPIGSAVGSKGRRPPEFSYDVHGNIVLDSSIRKALHDYRNKIEFTNGGGVKKLVYYLKDDYGFIVNHKKLYRLCKEESLLLPRKKKLKKNFKKLPASNHVVTAPLKVWQFDIKYGWVHGENRFFYLLAFIDVFSREVVDFYIGLNCKGESLVNLLESALLKANITHASELVIRSDNGSQMTCNAFREKVLELGLMHEYIPPATPNKNAYIESFFSIYEIEFLQVRYFTTFEEAYRQTMEFIKFYNSKRKHGSLKMMAPLEFKNCFAKYSTDEVAVRL